ncbi:MAG TPA: tetratricopeptide repeat protein [Fimbriimonadaceae bacterium]|nr:tetratricopeptide repeat protein [Fimbriimonadaceae bacterium]HRJ34161.1 tetratricopeptide repeat protein [Fimbriimonadaceae bacterium]
MGMMGESGAEKLAAAYSAVQSGQFTDAIRLADELLEGNPGMAEAHLVRGVALARSGQAESGLESMERSIALAPNSVGGYVQVAWQLDQMGRRPEAIQRARVALQVDPANAEAKRLLVAWGEIVPETASYQAPPPTSGPWNDPMMRPGYANEQGGLGFVSQMGDKKWMAIFWLIWLVYAILMVIYGILVVGDIQQVIRQFTQPSLQPTVLSPSMIVTLLMSPVSIALLVWGIMDIMHKKTSWGWIVVFLCCSPFLTWMYPVFGRNSD